jgi:pimeloyl-ACP methyl ester carboxylesterase
MVNWLLGLLALVGIVGYVGVNYATEHILPYSPIRPIRCPIERIKSYFSNGSTPSAAGLEWTDFDIIVEDTIQLRGWFLQSHVKPARGTIFLLHGIANCKPSMIPMAALLTAEGFNCILYDSRAHGESGGLNCTFGYYEKWDLSAYIDSAMVRFPGSGPFGVYGSSLGAAVAIQAMAHDKRLSCGAVESPFASLREIIHDYFARLFLIRVNSIPDRALLFSEQIAHFSVDSVQPVLSAANITQPIMVIHGLEDKHIASSYGRKVFESVGSREKEWYPIPGGEHNNVRDVGGVIFKRRVVAFFKRHLNAAT